MIFATMNQTIVPNSGPKLRLVEAAERLFAEKGFEAVSVRDITKEAGANVAAVNYHFGSREGLVVAVISRYLTPVNQERLARLDAAEKNGSDIEEIIAAYARPVIEQVGKSELSEKLYCQLVGRVFSEQGVSLPIEIEYQARTVVERFTRALSKVLPNFTPEELVWRLHFVVGGLIHLLTHSGFLYKVAGPLAGSPSMDLTITRFLKFSVAGLCEGLPGEGEQPGKEKTPQGLFNF